MLRLEKTKIKSQFRVSIKQKKSFFNPLLNIALLWAIGFHIGGLLLFHVVPFKINYANTVFPPVSVSADPGKIAEGDSADLEELVPIPSYLLVPQHEMFALPPISRLIPQKKLDFYRASSESSVFFLESETQWLAHGYLPLSIAEPSTHKMHLSGPIVDCIREVSQQFTLVCQQTLVFDILVAGRTGQVIWFRLKEGSEAYDQAVEEWLTTLHFSTSSEDMIQGKLEWLGGQDG